MSAQGAGELTRTVTITAGDTTTAVISVTCGEALQNAVVYSALRNNTRQVYAVRPDGTGEARITQDLGKTFGPFMSVASDGTKFVHVTGGPEVQSLEVVSSTGSILGTVPTSISCPTTPAWSPDGTRIAFNPCGAGAIRVINADGTGEVSIPNTFGYTPSWTADGTRLVYVEVDGDQSHLAVTSIDGSSRTVLTSVPGELVSAPDVSPDGSEIVFVRQIGLTASDLYLYVINIDGTGEYLLVGEPGYKAEPRWSPTGDAVIYRQDVPVGLWRVGADGGTPVLVLSESNLAWLAWTR